MVNGCLLQTTLIVPGGKPVRLSFSLVSDWCTSKSAIGTFSFLIRGKNHLRRADYWTEPEWDVAFSGSVFTAPYHS
jgi:hypothetical protein